MPRDKFLKLLQPAIVLPFERGWSPQALGVGSIVRHQGLAPSPVLAGERQELLVQWSDSVGRLSLGLLAISASLDEALARGVHEEYIPYSEDDPISSWDKLREKLFLKEMSLIRFVATQEGQLDLYSRVVREFGGRVKQRYGPDDVKLLLLKLILHREVKMTEVKEAAEAPETKTKSAKKGKRKNHLSLVHGKKAGKKAAEKKAAKKDKATLPSPSASESVGVLLMPLLKGRKEAFGFAKRMANGETLTKNQLLKLRDLVNEAAGAAREDDNDKLAEQLSAANRTVRRLQRQA